MSADIPDNLDLWSTVDRTDPRHVTKITGKQYQGSSPRPQWLYWKATETFGPCGIGWGFTIVKEQIVADGDDQNHFAMVRLWYNWHGHRGEIEQIGGTPLTYTSSKGKRIFDEDAPKKSVTDALVKALSMLGFAGDIFMGRWDDQKYMSELREEFQDRRAPITIESGRAPPIEQDQIAYIEKLITETKSDTAKFLSFVGAESIADMTVDQYQKALVNLARKSKAMNNGR